VEGSYADRQPQGYLELERHAQLALDVPCRHHGERNLRRKLRGRPALSTLLNGKADLSGDMALRIKKAFGVKIDTLMRMQSAHDIAATRKREKDIRVRRVRPPVEAHP
jgi:plasmid maintenance system antidote protein VapI